MAGTHESVPEQQILQLFDEATGEYYHVLTETAEKDLVNVNADESSSSCKWSEEASLLFLRTYQTREHLFRLGKRSHKQYWEETAKLINASGYNYSWEQCRSKMEAMKRRYKKIKDHNNRSGSDRQTWPIFFDILEEIFGDKPWVAPLATASSSGPQPSEISSENCTSPLPETKITSKRKREETVELYNKLKKDRDEEHQLRSQERVKLEEAKERRHQEKMRLRMEMLDIIKIKFGLK